MKKQLILLSLLFAAIHLFAQTEADSLAIVRADWQSTHLQEGLQLRKAIFSSLYKVPQEVSVLEIDPGRFRFDVQVHNGMERTSVVSRRNKAVAGINGSFYNMKVGNSTCYLQKEGMVIDTTSGNFTQACGAICIKKGRPHIIKWNREIEKKLPRKWKKSTILASGPLLMVKNEPFESTEWNKSFVKTKHPRSAVAVTQEGKVLFIVVDGRQKGKSEGVSIPELRHLIRVLGGRDILNVDGGGSSTLWAEGLPNDGIINSPSDKSGERKVSNSIAIYKK